MADNVAITSGTGTSVATDDVGGQHYQRMKLTDGTADSSAAIPGDATNGLYVQVRQAQRLAQYRGSAAAVLVAAAGTGLFFTITGSATKTVRVKRIRISGLTLTAVAYNEIECGKYSTSASGGTATAFTKVPLDSNDAAATAALVQGYTVAPTPGTLVGIIAARRVLLQATTAAAAGIPDINIDFDFVAQSDDRGGVVLRGTAQGLALNFNGAPASAVSMMIDVEWSEE